MFDIIESDVLDNIVFKKTCLYRLEAISVFDERVASLKKIGWHIEGISTYSLGFREVHFDNGIKVTMSPL